MRRIFGQDQMHNRQNNRWIAIRPQDVPRIIKPKFQATIIVFGVVSSEGDTMPLNIFKKGLRVNTVIYLKVMEESVLPWIQQAAGDRQWVWQQDSASCHMSDRSLNWLAEHCYDFVSNDAWPPSSPV